MITKGTVQSESLLYSTSWSIISGDTTGFKSHGNVPLSNFEPVTENIPDADADVPSGNICIFDARPDLFDGASDENVRKKILAKLNKMIIPTNFVLGRTPNFFVKFKKPKASGYAAELQVLRAGFLGADAMHSLQNFGLDSTLYGNKAYTVSVTHQKGVLIIYAHHVAESPEVAGRPEYFMTHIKTYGIPAREDFVGGVAAFQNAGELAKSMRNQLILEANRSATRLSNTNQPPARIGA